MAKKIAFFFYETRDINTYPSITNAVRLLTEAGYTVDVYLSDWMKTSIQINNARFILISNQDPGNYVFNSVKHIKANRTTYDFIFAFSFEGLVIVNLLNQNNKSIIPTVYFSMELIYSRYLSKLLEQFNLRDLKYSLIKILSWLRLQSKGNEFIKFSIIQDEDRGRILKEEFNFIRNIIYVPNSYLGFSDTPSGYGYDRFNIPRDKKILLYTGGLERGFDLGLLEMAESLDQEYILFLNAYSRDKYLDEVEQKFHRLIQEKKIVLNRDNLSEEEYDMLVKSSYIGVAWYQRVDPKNRNMYYLGLSSGKLTKFLSCGKPVIAPDYFHEYHQLIDGNGIGRTCSSAEEISGKIKEIEAEYSGITENVKNFYLKRVEYAKNFSLVLEEMKRYV